MPKYNIEFEFLGKKYRAKNVVAMVFAKAVDKVKDTFKITGGQEVENNFPAYNKNKPLGSWEDIVKYLKQQQHDTGRNTKAD